jgi:MSHA pilin protein MshD
MNNAEDNYQIIRQIQDGRDFLLTMIEQNPSLLKTAEPRIRELFKYERSEDVTPIGKQRGISLIELIIFIVIISVALTGILLVMNQTTAHSADPMVRKQALAIAESILEEVELMPFTYCDPDDLNAASATSATVGGSGCNSTIESIGLEAAFAEQPTDETRYHASTPFDNVNDYNGFGMVAGSIMDITNTNTGVNGYTLQPITVAAIDYGGITAASGDALLITVTVTDPSGTDIVLEGIRTRYSPRSLP